MQCPCIQVHLIFPCINIIAFFFQVVYSEPEGMTPEGGHSQPDQLIPFLDKATGAY